MFGLEGTLMEQDARFYHYSVTLCVVNLEIITCNGRDERIV